MLALGLASCSVPTGATGTAPPEGVRTFRGASDASAAEFLDATTIVVADDEDNVLRFYDAVAGDLPRRTLDLSDFLGLDPDDEADLEGSAQSGERIYWITSHGRNKSGKEAPERGLLFATEIVRSDGGVDLRPVGRPYRRLVSALVAALEPHGLGLAAAAGIDAEGHTVHKSAELAPKVAGLNVEALAASPDGARLYLGLRNPRPEIRGVPHAIVVALLEPATVVEDGRPPAFDEPMLWDLGGQGLRSMMWSEAHAAYLLIAGAHDEERRWRLWRWNGDRESPPVALAVADPPGEIVPEALTAVPGTRRLLALADDGDRRVPVARASDCSRDGYRDDGTCRNKQLRNPLLKSFRGFELRP